MLTIPSSQFELFTAIDFSPWRNGQPQILGQYQTFGQALDRIIEFNGTGELFEVDSGDPFEIDYYSITLKPCAYTETGFACIRPQYRYKIIHSLFTYKNDKPLVTEDFRWTYIMDSERKKSVLHL